ncbi:alpha/beta fold hydrolase [Nocardioides sp. zg-536]|uniref:Alpha/beta fold hydrolase n=1 Tax=Nocardioides faecalis TaxID=2803858 RepID=A0A939BYC0_9ACTN|nr:alpha/beta fold hydrolase [Nocardioides faecalis]MBM9459775.1 alpha/beta fold hydrolase [Nocardioides faecalis]MBS4753448.1 alpha/beta fold hydrolase [Nocardioides faecalis]QVI58288.1 alpha/beta fold hydrolase [Nocardioides faecalis]
MTTSDEAFAPLPSGVELCYQTFGEASGEPLLLVMGLGGPMTWWPDALCRMLAEAGFYVVRYDNRDIGRSSRMSGQVGVGTLARALLGRATSAPYSIDDLAQDALGLMDHLGLDSAHVVGVSMGGMVAQTMALTAPQRVRSLTSIMSTTGHRRVGWQSPALLTTLRASRGPGKQAYVERSVVVWGLIGSPGFRQPEEELRDRAGATWERGIDDAGVRRQALAVLTQPDRTPRLGSLQMPTLVMHGLDDRMVHVSGGRATARAIRGAELVVIPGWGHDLPEALYPTFVRWISRTAERALSAR